MDISLNPGCLMLQFKQTVFPQRHSMLRAQTSSESQLFHRFITDLFIVPLPKKALWFGFDDNFYGEGKFFQIS